MDELLTKNLVGAGAIGFALLCALGYEWYHQRPMAAASVPASTSDDIVGLYSNTMSYANNPDASNQNAPITMPVDQSVPSFNSYNISSRPGVYVAPSLTTGQIGSSHTGGASCSGCGVGWGWGGNF